jgi:hypothetical protein
VRIKIDLRIDKGCCELFGAARRKAAGKFVGYILALIVCEAQEL